MRRGPTVFWRPRRPTSCRQLTRLRQIAPFHFHTICHRSGDTSLANLLTIQDIHLVARMASSLLKGHMDDTVSPIGLRRPFSPQAERMSENQRMLSMKKSRVSSVSDEPMGIVITTGVRAPVESSVRAYVWGEWSPEPVGPDSSDKARV